MQEIKNEEASTQKKLRVQVAYATQTNTALEIALHFSMNLGSQILLQKFGQVNSSYIFDLEDQKEGQKIYVFFLSTTGQGDPPYKMRQFWKRIMQKNQSNLQGLKFAIFGLGDRGYGDNYNLLARKFRQRLTMLGATETIDIILGDQQDQGGCWQAYLKQFLPKFRQLIITQQKNENGSIINLLGLREKMVPFQIITNPSESEGQFEQILIKSWEKLSEMNGRTVFWVNMERLSSKQPIKIGDVLSIYPKNSVKNVEWMLKNLSPNQSPIAKQQLRNYLQYCANLQNTLNYSFFSRAQQNFDTRNLQDYIDEATPTDIKKLFIDKLQQLGKDYQEYHHYIKKYKRNVMEVIVDFNLKIPPESLIRRLSTIVPRKYSIAQVCEDGNSFGLLVKLQDHYPTSNRLVKGLCSYDLAGFNMSEQNEERDKIRVGQILRNGQFEFDLLNAEDFSVKNIMMISLGTGIAPFLSIMKQTLQFGFTEEEVNLVLFHSSRYLEQLPFRQQLIEPLVEAGTLKLYDTYTREKQNMKEDIEMRRLQFVIEQKLVLEKKYMQFFEQKMNNKVMICGPKEFCQIIQRILNQKLGLDVKKLKKNRVVCIQNW